MNARFWIIGPNCNPVKLTLRPGQTLHHRKFARTDEGWSAELNEWTHEVTHVENEWATDGVDCDGRLSRSGVAVCIVESLREGWADDQHAGVVYPKWKQYDYGQRDYSAEAMNY